MSLALQSVPSQARSLIEDKDVESHAVQVQLAKKERAATFSPALIFSLVLTSLLGIAGFIMAAWSTHQLKTANEMTTSLTSAILVTNPAETPADYSLVINMFRGTGYWSARKSMPFQRSDHGVAAYNRTVYIIGGFSTDSVTGNKTILSKFVQFDPVYSVYTNLTDMPEPRARFGWSVAGDKLYVFGGMASTDDLAAPVSKTMIYDFIQKQWTFGADISQPKSDVCAGTINNQVYMVGGYNADASVAFTDIEQYDPATNKWTVLQSPKLNLGRADCEVVVSGNQLYVLGGTYFKDLGPVCHTDQWFLCYLFTNTVERFDPVANTVVQLAPMRNARGDFGAAESTPGRILVAGGEYSDPTLGVSRLLAQPWVEEYDVGANYWTPKAPMPTTGFRFSMVNAAEEVIAFGGHPSCPSPDQSGDECYAEGMDHVLAFTDIQETYPNVYLLTRNPKST